MYRAIIRLAQSMQLSEGAVEVRVRAVVKTTLKKDN